MPADNLQKSRYFDPGLLPAWKRPGVCLARLGNGSYRPRELRVEAPQALRPGLAVGCALIVAALRASERQPAN